MPTRPFTAALASALVVALLTAACQGAGASPSTGPSTASTESSSGTTGPSASPEAYAGAEAIIKVAAGPRGVAAAGGSIWVASTIGGSLQRVDPTQNRVAAAIPLVRPVTLITLDDQLWASVLNTDPESDDEVVRIDVANDTVGLCVKVPVYHNIAAGAGAIWAVDMVGALRRIDPATGGVTVAAASVGGVTIGLAANGAGVWGIRSDGAIWYLPHAGASVREAPMGVAVPGRSRVGVAPGSGDVWVAVPTMVLAINPNDLTARLKVSLPGMSLVNDLWVTDTDVWLSANLTDARLGVNGGAVLRLDPHTGEIVAVYRLGPQSSGVVVADGSVWAVDQTDNVLARYRIGG